MFVRKDMLALRFQLPSDNYDLKVQLGHVGVLDSTAQDQINRMRNLSERISSRD